MHICMCCNNISMYVFIALVSGLMLRCANGIAQDLIDWSYGIEEEVLH